MVQVRPEPPGCDLRRQVTVGGGEYPHVDPCGPIRAHPLDLALLQHAQQLRLDGERQFTDLVEEQRAAVRDLELARAVGVRAGERTADVPEQLGLRQGLR